MTTSTRHAGLFFLRWIAAVLLSAAAAPSMAAIVVNSIVVNPPSTVAVAPGSAITVTITVTLTDGSRWRSTALSTSPSSSLTGCSLAPDINADGTWTRTLTVNAPNSSGLFSLNIAAWTNPNCNGVVSQTKTLPGGINTQAPATLNHVRLSHDGAALTCAREAVIIKACANADCTNLFTGSVGVTLATTLGNWSSNPVTITGGSGTVTLGSTTVGSATISGNVTSPATSAARCYRGNVLGSCTIAFDNGSCSADAVEVGKSNNTPIFTKLTNTPFSLDVLLLSQGAINTQATGLVTARIVNGTASGCSDVDLAPAVTQTFNASHAGRQLFTFTSTKASRNARVLLKAGTVTQCSSDNFSIRPSTMTVSSSGAGPFPPAAATATTGTTRKSGSEKFKFVPVAPDGYNGMPIVNSGRIQPLSGAAGTLEAVNVAAGALPSANDEFTYSEVGYFRLQPYAVYDDGSFAEVDRGKEPSECVSDDADLASGNPDDPNALVGGQYGCYFSHSLTDAFGRFIPDHFAVSDTQLVNRSNLTSCSAAEFTYMGETMKPSFILTAQNAANQTTLNYTGNFARLTSASQLGLGAIDTSASNLKTPFPVCAATAAHPCLTAEAATIEFQNGVSKRIEAPLVVFRGTNPVGPFDDFKVGIAPRDPDAVQLAAFNLNTTNVGTADNHALVADTAVRYGRLNIDNAYGSELLNLTVNMKAQYWNGTGVPSTSGYLTNTIDHCTPLTNFAFDGYIPGIDATHMPSSHINPGGLLKDGAGKIVLTKPKQPLTQKGSVYLRSSILYLPGRGRQTFGVYKSGPVIYVRETY